MATRKRAAGRQVALLTIAQYAATSPRMIPLEGGLDGSAERPLGGSLPVANAIAALSGAERARLVATYRQLFARQLALLAPNCAGEDEVDEAILMGALIAGVNDRHLAVLSEIPDRLELLEESIDAEADADPVEVLAFVLPGVRLWEDSEGVLADRALAALPGWLDEDEWEECWEAILGGIAEQLYGSWHERRLARMVEEVRGQLPLASHPATSALLSAGCRSFVGGRGVGLRIAARLLADVLPVPARQLDRRAA